MDVDTITENGAEVIIITDDVVSQFSKWGRVLPQGEFYNIYPLNGLTSITYIGSASLSLSYGYLLNSIKTVQ